MKTLLFVVCVILALICAGQGYWILNRLSGSEAETNPPPVMQELSRIESSPGADGMDRRQDADDAGREVRGDSLREDAWAEYRSADDELNRVYKKIFRLYEDDPEFLENLRKAQRAWIAFRDAHMEARLPRGPAVGSAYPMCRALHLAGLTRERTAQLRVWTEGLEEGHVDAGTVKRKHEIEAMR
jgi:uncharacterized protein YecT (DUF1311 family)